MARGETWGGLSWVEVALQCVGCGLLLALYCGGPLGGAFMGSLLDAPELLFTAQILLVAATGMGCLALWAKRAAWEHVLRRAPFGWCMIGCIACLVLMLVFGRLGAGDAAICVVAALLGMVSALPMTVWFEGFLVAYARAGRAACIGMLGLCELATIATFVPASLLAGDAPVLLAALVAACLGSVCCREVLVRSGSPLVAERLAARVAGAADATSVGDDEKTTGVSDRAGAYRLSPYSTALLLCFGVTWGLSFGLTFLATERGLVAQPWSLSLAGALTCAVLVAACMGARSSSGPRFGLLIRVSLVVVGAVLASVPVLSDAAPRLLWPLCQAAFVLQAVAMNLFAMEVCRERGLGVGAVWTLNFAVFSGAALVAIAVFRAATGLLGAHEAYDLLALIAAVATLAVIPLLPSSSSDAATFTMRRLPENEGFDARLASTKRNLAAKYGLSEREAQVCDLLLEGMSREQIARELVLSTWTVKDYVKSVYAKVGVHSVSDLLVLVAGGDPRDRGEGA